MPGVDSNSLARMVCVLCRCVGDRNPATALVDDTQRGRCGKLFCVGSRLGPRPGKPDLVLVQEHRNFYSADLYRYSFKARWISCPEAAAAVLPAIHALLHN